MSSCIHKARFSGQEEPTVEHKKEVKIAMILPEKRIGRYAHSTSTAVFAYFLTREYPSALKTFKIEDESKEEIKQVLERIKDEGYEYVIAPVTIEGAKQILEQAYELTIYLPTISRAEMPIDADNIYYGAIDYDAQIKALLPYVTTPLVIMYGNSKQGKRLKEMTQKSYESLPLKPGTKRGTVISYSVDKSQSSLRPYFEKNEKIQSGTIFLNTPLIKSTMIISQLSLYDVEVNNILSTQANYNPLLLSMTQKKDLKGLYIANSITIQDDRVIQANALLSNDIVYDWINYSTTVGADYFYYLMTGKKRIYDLPMVEHQLHYPITIVTPEKTHFKVVKQLRQ